MPFRFVYLTADISALSRSLDSALIFISCSVQKCEWREVWQDYYLRKIVSDVPRGRRGRTITKD